MRDKKDWIDNRNGTVTCPDCNRTYKIGVLPDDFSDPKRGRCILCDERVVSWAHGTEKSNPE
ncbi:MAG: hypothetical protein E6L00_04285 [Thaumarchaeota archaeon]|nr:MAG: hypothetical protein E6L00_04285 [Nitrososphaerota archaeon]